MTTMTEEKLLSLKDSSELKNALSNVKTQDELIKVLASFGVNLSIDDLNEIVGGDGSNELTEEQLEKVSGGKWNWLRFLIGPIRFIKPLIC